MWGMRLVTAAVLSATLLAATPVMGGAQIGSIRRRAEEEAKKKLEEAARKPDSARAKPVSAKAKADNAAKSNFNSKV